MPTVCRNCHFENPDQMRFCGMCGTRLKNTGSLPPLEVNSEVQLPLFQGTLVGADLLERFRTAGLEGAGQRRQVTVLFVDLSGYTNLSRQVDGEELYELVQRCSSIFANAVYRYDGMVDKFTGDGLMALFGAPIAHENNAELAIRAALDMQSELAVLSESLQESLGTAINAHIGLNSGTVVVGGIGSNQMMNYTAFGDVVNLANRIESAAAAGQILVSEGIYRKVKALFNFHAMPLFQLKGVPAPVQTYQVEGEKAKPGSLRGLEGLYSPMIGRDGELERLNQIVNSMVSEGAGRFVALHGESGLGKSRLISEFKSYLALLPVQVSEAFSLVYRRGLSFWIIQDALLRGLGLDVDAPREDIMPRLRGLVSQVLPDRLEEILPCLEYLLFLPISNLEAARRLESLPAGELRRQIFLAVRDLLSANARRQPIVLIFEDLHWADDASLDLIEFLLDLLPAQPIVMVAVSTSFSEGKLARLAARAQELLHLRFTDLSLPYLTPDQSDRLLMRLTSIQNLPEALRLDIVQRAAGIPLYLEEILRMLMDSQLLQRVEGRWQLAPNIELDSLGVPSTLEALILARFDNLEPLSRQVLKIASVIGRHFSRALLQACLPSLPDAEAGTIFKVLLEREFILADSSPEGGYFFRHVLLSDTIYSTLLKRERRELHGLVAESIERIHAGNLSNQVDVLARHYLWSETPAKALPYLILAGQKAARDIDTHQARKYFEDARSLLPDVPHSPSQAAQVHKGLADALSLEGDQAAAQAEYELARSASQAAAADRSG